MSKFTFDPQSQRYRASDGRYMPPEAVRAIIDSDIESSKERMQGHARRLQSGEVDAQGFQVAMMQEIKDLHISEVAAARGGASRMRQSDFGRSGQIIRSEYKYFQGLVERVESDPDYVQSDAFVDRCGLYSESGRGTYEKTRRVEMKAAGFRWVVNILETQAHHCEGANSCPAMSALGKVAIDDARFKSPGERSCLVKCRCHVIYEK